MVAMDMCMLLIDAVAHAMNYLPTRMLSGLMSPCSTLQRLSSLRARKSCCVYERTAFTCSPMSLPYFFSTCRKFILSETPQQHIYAQHLNRIVNEIHVKLHT